MTKTLDETPNGLVPIERKLTSERTAKVFMMRKAAAEMLEALEGYQIDAMYEIERAAVILAGCQMGPKDYSLNKIRTQFTSDPDNEWVIDQMTKYDDWKKAIDDKTFNITWDVCVYSTTARDAAVRNFCHHTTVMRILRKGLDEYGRQQGWICG